MGYGLLLRVTHTGLAAESIHVSDVRDGIDLFGGAFGFRKPGAIYVPTPAKGGVSLLVYSGDVAVSFESGGIRQFIQGGYLTAEFVAGDAFKFLLPSILDEGILLTETPISIDFVGAGVTATAVGDAVTVTIPGGGAATDHSLLLPASLVWSASAHTGTVDALAGFDAGGAAAYYSRTVTGDVSGTFPGPLSVSDLTITGEVQGSVLYYNGVNWTQLPPGTAGNVLTTQGVGANPTWSGAGTGDVTAALNLTDNALVRGDGGAKGVQDSGILIDDSNNMVFPAGSSVTVEEITEATAGEGVIVNGVRNYGKTSSNPAIPAPTDGDTYYNTALRMQMTYDGLRSKWLSVEAETMHFGRDGNTAAGQFYRAADGRVMADDLGWYSERSGTVISMAYTRTDSDAATFEIRAAGVSIATVASATTGGRNVALNADFTFGQILSVLNQLGGGTTSNVIAKIRVKWRV